METWTGLGVNTKYKYKKKYKIQTLQSNTPGLGAAYTLCITQEA
jgi:hypothetical protein